MENYARQKGRIGSCSGRTGDNRRRGAVRGGLSLVLVGHNRRRSSGPRSDCGGCVRPRRSARLLLAALILAFAVSFVPCVFASPALADDWTNIDENGGETIGDNDEDLLTQVGDALYYFFFGEITDGGGHAFEYDDTDGGGWGHAFDSPWWVSDGGDFGGGGSSSSSSSSVVTPPPPESDHGYVASYTLRYYPAGYSSEQSAYTPNYNSSGLYSGNGAKVGTFYVNEEGSVSGGCCKLFATQSLYELIESKISEGKTVVISAGVGNGNGKANMCITAYSTPVEVKYYGSNPYVYTDSNASYEYCKFDGSSWTQSVTIPIVYANYGGSLSNSVANNKGLCYESANTACFIGVFNSQVHYGNPDDQPSGGNDNPSGGEPSGGEPTGPTQPTYGGDTYTEVTNNYTTIVNNDGVDVDLTPVTSRQDAIKATLNQIGTDLDTMALRMDDDLKAMYKMQVLEVAATTRIYNLLKDIYARLDTLDKSTGDLVDLTTLERYAREISENTVPRTIDFTQFFNHFRTMETTLDNLDTDLILIGHELGDMTEENGGATLRGIVYGIYELLQDMASDVEDMTSDLELVVQALDNLQDANQLLTVRGYLKGIYDAVTALETGGGSDTDYSGVLGDIYAEVEDIDLNLQAFATAVSDALDGISNDLLTVIRELRNLRIRNPQTPQTPTLPPSDDTLNIDALRDALSRLMQKFPFATINNLIHIMTFLVRDPVAPVFDLPVPNPSDWSQPYMLRVDLSDFSQMAAVMRIGIVLWAIARISRRTVSMWTREEGGSGA